MLKPLSSLAAKPVECTFNRIQHSILSASLSVFGQDRACPNANTAHDEIRYDLTISRLPNLNPFFPIPMICIGIFKYQTKSGNGQLVATGAVGQSIFWKVQ